MPFFSEKTFCSGCLLLHGAGLLGTFSGHAPVGNQAPAE